MAVYRSPDNPIIKPEDIKPSRDDFEVLSVFNPGVTRFGDEVILLLRVAERPVSMHHDTELTAVYDVGRDEVVIKTFSKTDPAIDFSDPRITITPEGKFLTSLSHFRIARSKNGIDFEIDDSPAIFPANEYETYGLEDPRITLIEDTYCITYVAVSSIGITTCLISTKDFKTFEREGLIFCPDNKDVVLLPERIDGSYYALHRPMSTFFDTYEIWIAQSSDLRCWGNHHYLMGVRQGSWDHTKIGASCVPFKIEQGWLEVYHGTDKNGRYCLAAVLLDSKEPWKVLARSEKPILEPETDYETEGFFGNVVFSCGLLYEQEKLKIYYGVADSSIAYAEVAIDDVLKGLKF